MLDDILKRIETGEISAAEAKSMLTSYEELGFAKVDHQRKKRNGVPEIVFGEGKTVEQLTAIIEALHQRGNEVLVTRVAEEKAEQLMQRFPAFTYNSISRTFSYTVAKPETSGFIAIVCAGTSDLPVAEEAAVTAETLGVQVKRFYDVGVAGLHRLLDQIDEIRQADVSVCIAGMEGALPSVLGGLVENPVIAVPTSIGYGANFNGLSALLSMLNSCASGISVVNIDNGFGGAYNAVLIHRLAHKGAQSL